MANYPGQPDSAPWTPRCTFVDLDRKLDDDLLEFEALVRSGDLTSARGSPRADGLGQVVG